MRCREIQAVTNGLVATNRKMLTLLHPWHHGKGRAEEAYR